MTEKFTGHNTTLWSPPCCKCKVVQQKLIGDADWHVANNAILDLDGNTRAPLAPCEMHMGMTKAEGYAQVRFETAVSEAANQEPVQGPLGTMEDLERPLTRIHPQLGKIPDVDPATGQVRTETVRNPPMNPPTRLIWSGMGTERTAELWVTDRVLDPATRALIVANLAQFNGKVVLKDLSD